MSKSKFLTGFALIELIVVIAIITVLLTIAVSDFQKNKLQLSLSRVTYKFAQDVSRAQNIALSQVPFKDSSGTEQLIGGYGIYIDFSALGNKKYVIYADSGVGNQQYDALDYIVETIDFSLTEPGIIIKDITNVSGGKISINFDKSSLGINMAQLNLGQNSSDIIFAMESDLARTRAVLVNTSGLIEAK